MPRVGAARTGRAGSSGSPWLAAVVALALAALAAPLAAQEAPPPASAPAHGWARFEPGGATGCPGDAPYAYFAREGDPERLLVFLQGGGACWSALGCDPEAAPTYDASVGPGDHPARHAEGILAPDDPRNPFRGWSMLFVPYCTGDVHLGGAERRYPLVRRPGAPPAAFPIHHRGRANVEAALGWTDGRDAPARVFVAGESAGAIASPYWAAVLAERWPEARIAQLGDAAGGYRARAVKDLLATWGAAEALRDTFERPVADLPDFEGLYVGAGLRHPDLALARLDRADDRVQRFFLTEVGVAGRPLRELLLANLALIRERVPRVRQYLAPGETHTTLTTPGFYTLEVDGTRLRDWVAAHAQGEAVDDVMCEACAPR